MSDQLTPISVNKTAWLAFRTLVPQFTKLRFATGSCRWFPGDVHYKMAVPAPTCSWDWRTGFARARATCGRTFSSSAATRFTPTSSNYGHKLACSRFAARIPGPVDRSALRDKLVDGAWAGRFAHRFHQFKAPAANVAKQVKADLETLDDTGRSFPISEGIHTHYPDVDCRQALKRRHTTLRNRRQNTGAKGEASDERAARETLDVLGRVERLETEE